MAHGNGQATPLVNVHVPILGQVAVLGWTVLPVVKCPCGGEPLTLIMQLVAGRLCAVPAICAGCQTVYALEGIALDEQGLLAFRIGRPAGPPG